MRNEIARMAMGLAMATALAGSVAAQSVWTGAAGNWSDTGVPGWNGTGIPDGVGATADVSAATGTIVVNGTYTIGTLIHTNVAAQALWSGNSSQVLTFDVSSGDALVNLGTVALVNTWTVNLQLNDPLRIAFSNAVPNATLQLNGLITGTGGLVTDIRGATATSTAFSLALTNKNNSFSGGITASSNTVVDLYGTGTAGTGNIVLGNDSMIRFWTDSNSTFSNNVRVPNSSSYATFRNSLNGMTTTLSGNITGTGTARFGALNGSANGGTYILSGSNTVQNMMIEPINSNSVTVLIDNVNAMPTDYFQLSGRLGTTTKLLFNAPGTYPNRIFTAKGWANDHSNFTGMVGTKDTFTGTVVLDSTSDLEFGASTNGLILYAGNVNSTLEVKSRLTDGVGAVNLYIAGPGTVIVSRATGNAYDGATTVSNGTLIVNGVLGGAGAVTVNAGATLGGTGTVTGATTVNGMLKPGNSPGELNFSGNLTLMGGSTNVFEINGTSNADYDYVNAVGALTYGGTLLVNFGYTPAANAAFQLFDFGSQSGTFSSIQATGAYTGDTDFDYTTGVLTVIPEPGTLSVLGFGLVATLLRRKLRKI